MVEVLAVTVAAEAVVTVVAVVMAAEAVATASAVVVASEAVTAMATPVAAVAAMAAAMAAPEPWWSARGRPRVPFLTKHCHKTRRTNLGTNQRKEFHQT